MQDIIQYTVEAYGFLLARGKEYTSTDFANIINSYSVHARSKICASTIEASNLIFIRRLDGNIIIETEGSKEQHGNK